MSTSRAKAIGRQLWACGEKALAESLVVEAGDLSDPAYLNDLIKLSAGRLKNLKAAVKEGDAEGVREHAAYVAQSMGIALIFSGHNITGGKIRDMAAKSRKNSSKEEGKKAVK